MKKGYLIFLALSLLHSALAEDKVVGCLKNISTLSGALDALNKEITSCGYNKGLAEIEKNRNDQEKYVLEKLADKLVLQIDQNSEETALLTSFFQANGDDLMMNGSDPEGKIKKACSLSQIKEIQKCGGREKSRFYNDKLSLLMEKLNPSGKKSFFGDDLYGVLADKYTSNLGLSGQVRGNKLQCPLDGDVSAFNLQSQMDEYSASDIIKRANGIDELLNARVDSYAQLKLVKDAGKFSEFKKYLQEYKYSKLSAKDYIAKFFTDKQNQKEFLAPTLAESCTKINENINKFLCSDLDELGSLKPDTSKLLFNGLDIKPMDDQLIDFDNDQIALRAYGFQCMALAKSKFPKQMIVDAKSEQRLDDWYEDFTKYTRPQTSAKSDNLLMDKFCSAYSCSSEDSKKTPSCKSGGPLVSKDLSDILECSKNPYGKKCDSDALKSISYLADLEKLKTTFSPIASSSSSSPSSDDVKNAVSNLPDFAANYLGVEGTMKALGFPVELTQVTKEAFLDKKLQADPPPYQSPNANRTEFAKREESNDFGNSNSLSSAIMSSAPSITDAIVAKNHSSDSAHSYDGPIKGIHSKKKSKSDSTFWGDDIPEVKKEAASEKKEKIAAESTAKSESIGASSSNAQFDAYRDEVNKRFAAQQSRINSVSNELANTQNELARQRAEFERRLADIESKQEELKKSPNPKEQAEAKALAKEADSVKASIARLGREPASTAEGGGVIVTPEKLKAMNEDELKKMGVDTEESFVIAIKVQDEKNKKENYVNVPVIRHSSNGRSYLIPQYKGNNEEILRAIEKSPLFKTFIGEVKSKSKTFANLRDFLKGT